MPFKSKAQMRAAFGGYLGEEMQGKAKEWADKTPNIGKLPKHVKKSTKGSPPLTPSEMTKGYRSLGPATDPRAGKQKG